MSEQVNEVKTDVSTISVDNIDDLFDGVMSSDSVMVATSDKKESKPGFFSKEKINLDFIDEESSEEVEDADELGNADITTVLNDLDEDPEEDDEVDTKSSKTKVGRPTVDKKGMAGLVSKLIEGQHLVPFLDDDRPLEEYTLEDYEELITKNLEHKEESLREQVHAEFFDSLPPKMQQAVAYIANGGRDLEALFSTLSRTESLERLDPSEPGHQEKIVRSYLEATNYGNSDEIDEEIEIIKDNNRLEAKAKQFKPKLDNMQEEIVQSKLEQQEQTRKRQEQSAAKYANSIYKALETGKLGEMKLDSRTQNMLYKGLVQATYPSISGRPTNMLGHLLEKYQFEEPNHELIAEVLYHLADPKGFKEQLTKVAKNETVGKAVRQLKGEQASKQASGNGTESFDRDTVSRAPGIKRTTKNFFQR